MRVAVVFCGSALAAQRELRRGSALARTALAVHHAQHPVRHVRRPRHKQVVPPRRGVAVRCHARRSAAGEGASGACGGALLRGTCPGRGVATASQRGRVRRCGHSPRLETRGAGAALRAERHSR